MSLCRLAVFALLGLAEGEGLYAEYWNTHCYQGHGGTPLSGHDNPIRNTTRDACREVCDNTTNCIGVSTYRFGHSWHHSHYDCYLLSGVDLVKCHQSPDSDWGPWSTYVKASPPPLSVTTYHLFQSKYTGLGDKDAADFNGDASFIFETFSPYSQGNPEGSLEHNIIEMSKVNVTGWGTYEFCNAPGAQGDFNCSIKRADYCCTIFQNGKSVTTNHTRTQLPGLTVADENLGLAHGFPGYWFSFPKESEGVTWTEKKIRRIAGKCLGDAWRKAAGGCPHCNDKLEKCAADCIQAALVINGSTKLMQAVWDRAFGNPKECPDVPYPGEPLIVV